MITSGRARPTIKRINLFCKHFYISLNAYFFYFFYICLNAYLFYFLFFLYLMTYEINLYYFTASLYHRFHILFILRLKLRVCGLNLLQISIDAFQSEIFFTLSIYFTIYLYIDFSKHYFIYIFYFSYLLGSIALLFFFILKQ